MTQESLQDEYNKLIAVIGTAVLSRMLFLSSEIQRLQKEAACLKTKENPDTK